MIVLLGKTKQVEGAEEQKRIHERTKTQIARKLESKILGLATKKPQEEGQSGEKTPQANPHAEFKGSISDAYDVWLCTGKN
mgnify:CR=1 FL=1